MWRIKVEITLHGDPAEGPTSGYAKQWNDAFTVLQEKTSELAKSLFEAHCSVDDIEVTWTEE